MKTLFAGASALILGIAMAGAVQAAEAEVAADAAELDAIIVTGTRTTGLRAIDSPAPITVLDSSALQRVGQGDLIQAIAQNVPSFTAQAFGGDTANLTLSAKLRGLSPNHALVLINGKRRHGTANLAVLGGPYQGGASADLNFVPLGAIDHIEVLQEGAAAQYGSDAIAGVINIILKNNAEGGTISAAAGKFMSGGGDTAQLSLNAGFAPVENAYVNLTYESRWHAHTFRGDVDPRALDTTFNVGSSNRLSAYPQIRSDPDFPYLNRISGDAEYRLNIGSYNLGYTVGDLELYSFGTYGHKFGAAYENWRTPSRVVGQDGTVPRPLGFKPKETLIEDDYAATAGIKGKAGEWAWDLATTYGKDDEQIETRDSLNAALYVDTSTPTTPGFSPTDFVAGSFISTQWTSQLDVVRDFDVGMASPLTLALGAEYRRDTYEIRAGDEAARYKEGSQSFPGFLLTDAGKHSRRNYGIYGDVAVEPSEGLKVDVAARYEHFSDFGDAFVVKGTARYDVSDALAFRGTASTGFRAPTLAEEFYSATNVGPTSAFVQLPPNAPAAALVGVNGLDAEKSRNFSLGVVAHPGGGITATLDIYQIGIRDRVVGSGSLYGTGGTPAIPAVTAAIIANGNVLDPTVTFTGIQIFTNGLNTRTRGAELVLTASSSFDDWGSVQWSLVGNYSDTEVTKIAPSPPELGGAALFDITALDYLEKTTPKYRAVAGALWTWDRLSVNLRETLYGPSSLRETRDGTVYYKTKIKTALLTDLEISYDVFEAVKVSVGANNLFNKYPTRENATLRNEFTNNENGYVQIYPTFSPFGINGGYYYGKLTVSF